MSQNSPTVKGFNDGYLLEKHKPELASQIQQGFVDKTHEYAQGFTAGRQEYGKEQELEPSTDIDNYIEKVNRTYHPESQSKSNEHSKDNQNDDLSL